jgi:hypothetical protein
LQRLVEARGIGAVEEFDGARVVAAAHSVRVGRHA